MVMVVRVAMVVNVVMVVRMVHQHVLSSKVLMWRSLSHSVTKGRGIVRTARAVKKRPGAPHLWGFPRAPWQPSSGWWTWSGPSHHRQRVWMPEKFSTNPCEFSIILLHCISWYTFIISSLVSFSAILLAISCMKASKLSRPELSLSTWPWHRF